ncbi:hypothetical protein M3Y99_00025900 [Aphelenchoides fujianensis]|nr:hypothetical protein M3Y99_00025900 [Aphelenchoides fujianensis]
MRPERPKIPMLERISLPHHVMRFLNQIDSENPPDEAALDRLLADAPPEKTNFLANQVLIKNLPIATVCFVKFFVARGLLDEKSVIPAVRALAKAWVQEPFDEETRTLCSQLYPLLPDNSLGKDARLLLDMCRNEWPVAVDEAEDVAVLRTDVFNAAIVGCLRHSDFKQLSLLLKMFPSIALHSDPHVFAAFCRSISSGNHNLVRVYLQHLEGRIVTEGVFEHVLEVVRPQESARPEEIDGKCASCQGALIKRHLNAEEFGRLNAEVTEFAESVCTSFRKGSMSEFAALRRLVYGMVDRGGGKKRTSIVIDLLNLSRGRHFNLLDGLLDFIHETKRNSNDDMFAICAALWLGEETILVSNDRFTDFELNRFSNLLHYDVDTRKCHFTVISTKHSAMRKFYCLSH